MTRLVVVGAGITGLAAAFEWRRRRPDDEVVVLEAGDRIGGKLDRGGLAGHWYDTGPAAAPGRRTQGGGHGGPRRPGVAPGAAAPRPRRERHPLHSTPAPY